jgi:hypothetical protein
MAARLTWVAERINLEAPGMPRQVDTLSGLAPLLRVRPELQQLCRFGAQWSSDHFQRGRRLGALSLTFRRLLRMPALSVR